MNGTDELRNENVQTMITRSEREKLKTLAEQEHHTESSMARILLLESLDRWLASAAGRRRKK